ncbi:hypothetical protein V6N11_034371 [Hibiscus sabdariffa]|uniref:RNase H type-1 domain-containing protein n=1 Tax=Hibiscus sabdariffa TaxID=183260 RepID=A0ABR2NAS4_9ROSI
MDCRIWKYERSGVYTVSNGYNFLTRSSCEQHEGLDQHSVNRKKSFYGSLCSLKAPPKVKITFCRFVNNFIPTFANLYSRRLNVEVTCVLCSNTHPHSFILDQEMAKARSCEQTVYLVWDLRFRKLVFEGEALSVISKINSSTDDISGINAILENIYKESSYFHSFSFIHVWRSCNEDAYALALEAEARDRFLIFGVLNTWFERVENWKASCGMDDLGSVICVKEETLEPTSFERGRVLIESSSLDRIEYKIDLKVLNDLFPLRVSEAELFLRGPHVGCAVREDQIDGSSSEKGESLVNSEVSDVGINPERGVEEGECPAVPVNLVASQATGVGEKEQVMWQELPYLDGLNGHMDLGTVGPVMPPKGSTTESRGHGRPHKGGEAQVGRVSSASFSDIADISIMDSDVNYRQSAILQEAKATETKLATVNNRLVKQVWWSDSYAFAYWFGGRDLGYLGSVQVCCRAGGNFNEVKSSAERRGCVGDWGVCWSSSILYMMGGFVDLLAVRKVFTWYDSGSKGSRLDLFLVSAEWLDHFEVEAATALLNELDELVTDLDIDIVSLRRKARGIFGVCYVIVSRFGVKNQSALTSGRR